jgi:1-acyl-sn-glycerol-3-phosphate acyltransferase
MCPRLPRHDDRVFRVVRELAGIAAWWHRADCEGVERLPGGAALLVGNHGIFGFEVPIFFYLIHKLTSRFPIGLADRNVFAWRPLRELLARCGGHLGTVENARALLAHDQLVVCYPGGSREVFKAPGQRYRLCWERSSGFARLAIRLGVAIVPFAGLGVDDSYLNFGHLPGTCALFGRYALPLAVGLGPLPLPVRFRFRLGMPIAPPSELGRAEALKDEVAAQVRALLAGSDAGAGETRHGQALAAAAAVVR